MFILSMHWVKNVDFLIVNISVNEYRNVCIYHFKIPSEYKELYRFPWKYAERIKLCYIKLYLNYIAYENISSSWCVNISLEGYLMLKKFLRK